MWWARRWRTWSIAILLGTAACGGRGGGEGNPSRTTAGVKELAPSGAEVAKLTIFDAPELARDVDVAASGKSSSALPPLLAYRELCGDIRLGDFGLQTPRLRVQFRKGNADVGSLAFGDPNFAGGGVYTLREGSPCVYLVTMQAVLDVARLGGDAVLSRYGPVRPQSPDLTKASNEEQIHPWVAQARRHEGGR